jgi:hypothetical protein
VPTFRNVRTGESQMRAHVSKAFAGRALQDIKPADVNAWLGRLKTVAKLEDSSRKTMRMRLSAVFSYAVTSLKWLAVNPVADALQVKPGSARLAT